MTKNDQRITLSPLNMTVIYLIVAGIWIAFTDRLLDSLVTDAQALSILQTYKGWFYVALTGAGLYWLIKKHDQQLQKKEVRLGNLLEEVKSEKELKDALFERIPILITIYDPDLEEFEVNREFEKVTGWTNQEITEKNIDLLKAVYPDLETRKEAVEFMNNPGVGWKEFELTKRDGDKIPTSWTDIRLTDNTSVGIGIDMTDIKASQAKVRESRELLKKIFESLESSLIVIDTQNRTIADCNSATEKIFGYSQEELIGSSTKMLHVDEESFQKFDKMGAEALENKGFFQTEFKMQKKDGTVFYSDHTVTLVYDEEGKVNKAISVVRDITDRKNKEKELQKRHERLLRSQKIGKIGDWELDPKTKEISWSATMFEIYERNPELGAPNFDQIQSNYPGSSLTKHNKAVERALEKKESSDIDLKLKTDEGNNKFVRAIIIPIENDENEVIKLLGTVQDITQRKQSERELKKRKDFIETTLANLPIGVAVNTIDEGQRTLMNKKFTDIYGWPKEILRDVDTFFEKVFPDDTERKNKFKKDIESGNPERMQWQNLQIATQEGERKIVNAKNIPLPNQNLMISTVVDVTEQHELEQELKREKQRFQLVAETTSDVIWDLDFENEELWWSQGFEEIFGYERKGLRENYKAWEQYIHPEDREKVAKSSKQALESDTERWTEEYRLIKSDDSVAYLIDRAIIIRDEQGTPVRMVGTMDDITERKKAQEQLRESEEKYRHLFENNPEPMWIYDPDTLEFVEVNQAAIDHYGYSEEEFMEMSLLDIRPEEDAEALKESVKENIGKASYSEEWVHLKKDGSRITVELSASDVQYKRDKTYRLVLINDITEKKRMQEKIIQSVIEGEDRERKRIAHELHDGLGQYLVAASMNLQSAKADIEKLSEKRQNQLETGISLLKNALSETRNIAHNLMPQAISDYGLIAALENLINDFRKSTDIDFQLTHNCDQLELNNQSEINIYRIFQEIITNAIRHSECTTIMTELHLSDDTLTLIVEDDGVGAQLDEQDEYKGVGLRSIKTRVSNLKGNLEIESEPQKGMKTTITIPNIHTLKSNTSSHG